MLLRLATRVDATELSQLAQRAYVDTFVEEFGIVYPPHDLQRYLTEKLGPAHFEGHCDNPTSRIFVAEDAAGTIQAYALAGAAKLPHPDLREGDGELKQLYVLRAAQSQGVGRELFKAALDWLQQDGPRRLWIGVWSGNEKAYAFYRRYGFAKVGEYDYEVGDSRDLEFILFRDAQSVK